MNSDIKPGFEKLLPCPFCGGLPEIKQTGRLKIKIRCTKCHIGIEQKVLRFSLEWLQGSLTESWNKRESNIGLLEALQKILTHTRDNTIYQIAKEAIDKRHDHVEPLLSTVKRLQEENERYKEALKQISEENYDDDDRKRHLYATIDRIKAYAQTVIDDLPTGPTVGNIEM